MELEQYYGVLLSKTVFADEVVNFRPITIIEGEYDEEEGVFLDQIFSEYYSFNNLAVLETDVNEVVGYVIKESELLELEKTNDIVEAKTLYLQRMLKYLHFGMYDFDNPGLLIKRMEFEDFSQTIFTDISGKNAGIRNNYELNGALNEEAITKLLNIDDASEIHNELISILEDYKNAKIDQNNETFINEETKKDQLSALSKPKDEKTSAFAEQIQTNLNFNVQELYDKVSKKVIGQEEAIRSIVSAIAMDRFAQNPSERNRCLLVGPTGCGKTEIIRTISEYINVPMVRADSTQLTVPGYVGGTIEEVLERLVTAAGGDMSKAEEGIIAFDEIDKKGTESNSDISGKGVLNTLLPFIDGTDYLVKFQGKTVPFNTSKLTIFASGAFTDVYNGKYSLEKTKSIGFKTDDKAKEDDKKTFEPADFIKYGNMPDEFMGRFSTIAVLNALDEATMKKILLESTGSPLKAEARKLANFGIDLKWQEEYIDAVAKAAYERKIGGRALKGVVESTIKDARWEVLLTPDAYEEIELVKETVSDSKQYILKAKNQIKKGWFYAKTERNIRRLRQLWP